MNGGDPKLKSKPEDKPVYWISSAKKDLTKFSEDVVDVMGFGLRIVQRGGMPDNAKPLTGFGGADVLEIVENYNTDTYRVVYTVRFKKAVYVLHAFMKKSKQGIKTPQKELDLIKSRLACAQKEYRALYPDEK